MTSRAVVVGAVMELLLLAGVWLTLGTVSRALGAWLAAGGVIGFCAGWMYVRQAVRLVPAAA